MKTVKILLALFIVCAAFSAQAQRAMAGHFAPFSDNVASTSLDVKVDGFTALENVKFGDFTEYFSVGIPGTYTLQVFETGAEEPLLEKTVDLTEGDSTLLFLGDGTNQPLDVLVIRDNNDPPAAGNFKFRVVHGASFAADPAATAVSIRTGGGDVIGELSEVQFGGSSDYMEAPAGSVDLKVATPDGLVNLIDPMAVPIEEGAIVTFVATGNGTLQPLGISALPIGSLETRIPVDITGAGIFFNPETGGQGAQMQVFPRQNRILGFMYTFDTVGANQAWIHFDSCNNGPGEAGCSTPGAFDGISAPVTFYVVEGGVFNDPAPVSLNVVGTGQIDFTGCDAVTLSGDVGNGVGEVSIDYIRLGDRAKCTPALQ